MIEIVGIALNQWDINRAVRFADVDADKAHFANKGDSVAVIIDISDSEAKIPNFLLQTGKQLCVYAVKDGVTLESKTFSVRDRQRPENYVYDEDRRNYIYELITSAENAIDGAVRAVKEAEDAVESANAAVKNANNSAENANNAASNANNAAEAAYKALENMDLNFVKTVNGVAPDENGNVVVEGGGPGGGIVQETDPTVPAWAKQPEKPTYTAAEVGALPSSTVIPTKPEDIGAQPSGNYALKTEIPNVPVQSVNGKTGAVNLNASDVGARPSTWMPTAQEVGALPSTYTPPNQTADQVGADPKGTAANAVSQHNTADDSHNDIRLDLKAINDRLTAFFDSDDQTLDELSEIVAYITSNKTLIDAITTSKVSVTDIINNLSTNASTKPLSAAQGVALKALIDAITVPTKLSDLTADSTHRTVTDTEKATWNAKSNFSGNYADLSGKPTIPTVPTNVSAFTNDAGYLTRHQDISGKLDASALPSAINTALAQAKASGEFDGPPGDPGEDGHNPVRGVDYWTTADKAEIEAYIATELAKRGQLAPEYADSIEKCTDTTKLYVLPDGMIYAYMMTEKVVESGGGDYTNLLHLAVNADGTPYVGNNGEKGYKTDTRLNSSKAEVSQSGMCCTGFMPITPGATGTLRFKDITPRGVQGNYLYAFGSDRSTGKGTNSAFTDTLINSYDSATGVYTLVLGRTDGTNGVTVGGINDLSSAAYLRISLGNINENTIITWNEEITEKSTEIIKEYAWASTGLAFVPADYEDRIIELEKETAQNTVDIATLKNGAVDTGGVDALTWIRNWDSPIYDRVPVFQLSAENPAVTSADKTVDGVYAKYDALMSANPRYITKTNMGMCSDGVTPVYRYDFREPEPHHQSGMQWSEEKPTIIIVSGIHIEWGGIYSLYYALKEITENPELDDLRRNVHFVVVPVMNPYCIVGAYSTNYGVQNANGVEIHRNFEVGFKYPGQSGYIEPGNRSHGGTAPLSEVESQYIDNLFKQYPDAALFMTCHSAQRDTRWGTGFIWASTATEYTCNLGYRLVDKLSKAWHKKYGKTWEEGCVRENNFVLADPTTYPNGVQLEDGDYRAGHAHVSSTNGTETRQATKYGIQGANVEVLDTFWVLSSTGLDSKLTTHGAEVYINYLLMYMGCYDHKDKKQYYIG